MRNWPLERTFGESCRRVKVIGRLPGESTCLSLVWAVLDRASGGWRGLDTFTAGIRRLHDLRRRLLAASHPGGSCRSGRSGLRACWSRCRGNRPPSRLSCTTVLGSTPTGASPGTSGCARCSRGDRGRWRVRGRQQPRPRHPGGGQSSVGAGESSPQRAHFALHPAERAGPRRGPNTGSGRG